jgi:hypothetical protein
MTKGVKTGGRTIGSVNKATADVRMCITLLAERNVSKLEQWLEDTANGDVNAGVKPDPGKAAALLLAALEYHIPKLARTEHTGTDGGPIDHSLTVNFVGAK